MTRDRWCAIIAASLIVGVAVLACGPSGSGETPAAETPVAPSPSPGGGRCGDGTCEGPENAQNCPQDCAPIEPTPADVSNACLNPNPHRAVVSQELVEFYNWLDDGGFEEGVAEVVLSDHHEGALGRATVERSQAAARTGSWGHAITAGPGEGVTFSIKAYVEKGEDIRFSFWARSAGGEVSLQPLVFWVENEDDWGQPMLADPVTVGAEWTQVRFVTEIGQGIRYALLSFEVGPGVTLHVDDVQVELPLWKMAAYAGPSRTVGGIPVPPEPVAPVHFTFLIHIEDPNLIQINEPYFQQKTAVFRELARIFHEHGGFLTIQPEQDWPQAAEAGFHPGLLAELAGDYGVVYSTHTHGPNCHDDQGAPRSAADCNANQQWDRTIGGDDIVEYVKNLRDLLADASGTPVTDHNGNFDFTQASRFSEVPMLTWSVYKNYTNQRTYDRLINNPWRPAHCNAVRDVETFLAHDPNTDIVYIPGWGQALTRHHERALTRLGPMVSQFIYYADPDRVNTFYTVLHVDHFHARDYSTDYISYDERTGEITYSDEFLQHLQYWDDVLTELIDPLVAGGYLQWTSLPEMGRLYLEWEEICGSR